jgi:hypothetical protein
MRGGDVSFLNISQFRQLKFFLKGEKGDGKIFSFFVIFFLNFIHRFLKVSFCWCFYQFQKLKKIKFLGRILFKITINHYYGYFKKTQQPYYFV